MHAETVRRAGAPEGPSDLLEAIQGAQQAAHLHLVPEAHRQGVSPPQFWSLYHLLHGGEVHPSRLARRLGITASACTATVDQLVEAGFVVRRPSEEDRRQVVLAVTPKGRRLVDAVWRPFDRELRTVTADLSAEDVRVAARVLRTVAERLRPPRPEGASPGGAP